MSLLYEVGDDLDEEEIQRYASLEGVFLSQLPGGGIQHDVSLTVVDNATDLRCELIVEHVDGLGSQPSANEVTDSSATLDPFILNANIQGEISESPELSKSSRSAYARICHWTSPIRTTRLVVVADSLGSSK